jgi:hypothetical protein
VTKYRRQCCVYYIATGGFTAVSKQAAVLFPELHGVATQKNVLLKKCLYADV